MSIENELKIIYNTWQDDWINLFIFSKYKQEQFGQIYRVDKLSQRLPRSVNYQRFSFFLSDVGLVDESWNDMAILENCSEGIKIYKWTCIDL